MDWFGLLITALTDRAQCGLPDNRLGLMWPPDNSTNGLVQPADNSTYGSGPMWLPNNSTNGSGPLTFNPAGASLVLLSGVWPLTLNAGQPAALIEYISSIRIVDSCSCIAECSCSLLTGSGCSLLTEHSCCSLLTEHSCSHLSDWGRSFITDCS